MHQGTAIFVPHGIIKTSGYVKNEFKGMLQNIPFLILFLKPHLFIINITFNNMYIR